MASFCKLPTINLPISPDIEDHVIKHTPDSMILESEISPKTFETFEIFFSFEKKWNLVQDVLELRTLHYV